MASSAYQTLYAQRSTEFQRHMMKTVLAACAENCSRNVKARHALNFLPTLVALVPTPPRTIHTHG